MTRPVALIVDDEDDLRTLMRLALGRIGIDCTAAASITEAMHALATQTFNFCLTDLNLPDGSGMTLLEHIVSNHPNMPTAVITAYGSSDLAVKALKIGAFDFVSKPLEIARLRELVERALKVDTTPSVEQSHQSMAAKLMLGNSPVMQRIRATLSKLARSQAPVYIHG